MAGKKGKSDSGGSGKRGAAVDSVFQGDRVRDEYDDRCEPAVERSVESFVKGFAKAFAGRSREDVARHSYGGGMLDALYVVHDVLGSWGAEKLCQGLERELEAGGRGKGDGDGNGVAIQVRAAPGSQGALARGG